MKGVVVFVVPNKPVTLTVVRLRRYVRLTRRFSHDLSAEELLPESRVLLHAQRRHLRPLPVVQHADGAGEGNSEDEPVQDRRWSDIQSQGETSSSSPHPSSAV